MKATYLFTFLFFFSFLEKNTAQTSIISSGVYVTIEDFKNNRLIEEADCKNNKEKIERHDFFSKQEFVVINKGKKLTYQKKDIYAYRDCENKTWRFCDNKEYQILETKVIYIYSLRKIVLNGATIEKDAVYYFSNGPSGEIKELSISNLKVVYPNNQVFHNMLDAEFNSDKAIQSYDVENKMYKVNYLLIQSKK